MRTLLLLSISFFATSIAHADIDQNPIPAPTPRLQVVNSATSQLNNDEPMLSRGIAPEAQTSFPNQQAMNQQNQNVQVPDVSLPYPITPDPPAPPQAQSDEDSQQ